MIDTVSEQKRQLRQHMLKRRKALSSQGPDTSSFLEYPVLSKAKSLATYWPMAGELDVRPLMHRAHKAGKQVCLPVVVQKASPLIFRQWVPDLVLEDGPHQTCHPSETQMQIDPDVILVPLLAFDQRGGRLGFGGGYYDRTLALRKAIKVAVAFDEQEVDEVPVDTFDQRMDWIVTPTRAIEVRQHKQV